MPRGPKGYTFGCVLVESHRNELNGVAYAVEFVVEKLIMPSTIRLKPTKKLNVAAEGYERYSPERLVGWLSEKSNRFDNVRGDPTIFEITQTLLNRPGIDNEVLEPLPSRLDATIDHLSIELSDCWGR
jgi:hypothetical protein